MSSQKNLLGGASLTGVDLGARGGVPDHWRDLLNVATLIAFEPDPEAQTELESFRAKHALGDSLVVVPAAVAGASGDRTLHVTATPSGSSLLSPDTPLMRRYGDHFYLFPIREITVPCERLSEALESRGLPSPNFLKIDVQGVEVEVLESIPDAVFDQIVCVEVEAGIGKLYADQRDFFELHSEMVKRGFALFDLRTARAYRTPTGRAGQTQREVLGVSERSYTVSARLVDVDAIYFRDEDQVLARRDPTEIARLAALYCTYNFYLEALDLITQAKTSGALDAQRADAMTAAIKTWHGAEPGRWMNVPNALAHFVRQVFKALHLGDQRRWAQYMWRSYPNA